MKAKSIQGRSSQEIEAALKQGMADGFAPTLAIVFLSVKQDLGSVCAILSRHGIRIFGATTSGEFISSEISEGGIAIMLLDMNVDFFTIRFLETSNNSDYESARQLGSEAKAIYEHPAFILATGWQRMDGEMIIKGVEDGVGGEAAIFGGIAGDDLSLTGPRVFTNEQDSITGIVALIIDADRVAVSGVATCGWKPIGIAKTVTRSEGNVVYTIDEQPAFDLFIKYLGLDESAMPAITDTIVNLGAYYPLQLDRRDAPAVMRTAQLGNIVDRSIVCAGNVPQGTRVRFSLPPDFDVLDTVLEDCEAVKNSSQEDADAVIMFSCISRYLSFGTLTSEELARVSSVWNTEFIGFFSYGEYGKSAGGKHEFHNNTCCVVTLKEK